MKLLYVVSILSISITLFPAYPGQGAASSYTQQAIIPQPNPAPAQRNAPQIQPHPAPIQAARIRFHSASRSSSGRQVN